MRVVVTGGAGFIGSHICEALIGRGAEVSVIDNLSTGRIENIPAVHMYEADITQINDVDRLFRERPPEVVFHLAAQTSVAVSVHSPVFDAHSNVLGTINVLNAALRYGVKRFIFSSTGGAIYGEVSAGLAGSDRRPDPMSPYGCSKLAGEAYVACMLDGKMDYDILRYANVYGPRQDPHGEAGVVAIFIRRILDGEPIKINASGDEDLDGVGCVRDYVYVEDVVSANLFALDGDLEGMARVNVGTGIGTTTRDIALAIGGAAHAQPRMSRGNYREGDLKRSVLESSFRAIWTLSDGIAKTVEWFRANKV